MSTPLLVEPKAIQAELVRIWDSLEGTNKMRACLFNLVIYTENNERIAYVKTIAERIIEKFPSRVIFITIDKGSENNDLKTYVSVMSSSTGEVDIVCDLIQIDVSGTLQERLPFLILPHLLPDLPLYVVWTEPPPLSGALFNLLEKYASRIIFDSECANPLESFAQAVLERSKSARYGITDLNWARTENYREVINATFHAPEKTPFLERLRSVLIEYNALITPFFCHTTVQSLYLQGWLASVLGWTLETKRAEAGAFHLFYQTKQGPVTVSLIPTSHSNLNSGGIVTLEMTTYDEAHFSFTRDLHETSHITAIFSTSTACELPCHYLFPKPQSGQSLMKEICRRGTSSHFLNLLNLLKNNDAHSMG